MTLVTPHRIHKNTPRRSSCYWALLAEVVSEERAERFFAHLENTNEFNRHHRIPTLAADHPLYDGATGDYWRGGVWAPANYMVLRGLTKFNRDALAHDIATNHLRNVVEVFSKTGTVWENYAPELVHQGRPAKPDFVGWTGLTPIAVLFEYVFGLRPNAAQRELLWDIRLTDMHGVEKYPLGPDTLINLRCERREDINNEPQIKVHTNQPFTLIMRWNGGEKLHRIQPL